MHNDDNKIPKNIFHERLKAYSDNLLDIINTSNEQFEKQLSYISGGALALSFILIEKVLTNIFTTHHKAFLILGWVSLTATLLINLFSHKKAIDSHSETLQHVNDCLNDSKIEYDKQGIIDRNKSIKKMNEWSLYLLSLGLVLLILYTSINLVWLKK